LKLFGSDDAGWVIRGVRLVEEQRGNEQKSMLLSVNEQLLNIYRLPELEKKKKKQKKKEEKDS
jgi:hypothetical protein